MKAAIRWVGGAVVAASFAVLLVVAVDVVFDTGWRLTRPFRIAGAATVVAVVAGALLAWAARDRRVSRPEGRGLLTVAAVAGGAVVAAAVAVAALAATVPASRSPEVTPTRAADPG